MTTLTTADLYAEWLTEIKAAATELRRCVKASKHNQEQCCEVLNRALEAVMSLEHTIGIGHLRLQQRQELPSIVAATISNIEFAQSVVKVNSRHWHLSSCTCLPCSHSAKDKLSTVSNNLHSIGQRARELHRASLDEAVSATRTSGRMSNPELPQRLSLSGPALRQRFMSSESI